MSLAKYANLTNYWTEGISSELNRQFGSRRIMHGSEAQLSGGLANKEGDSAVVFHPTGDVMIYEDLQIGSGDHRTNGDLILLDIIKLYFPKQVLTH
jgi:hypothetical protein